MQDEDGRGKKLDIKKALTGTKLPIRMFVDNLNSSQLSI